MNTYRYQQVRRISLSASISCFLALSLMLSAGKATAADPQDVVIHESDGLWVMRQPWPESAAWCQNGGGSPAKIVYDVYTYYDSPHARRMERLGESYESFVRDKVVTGIKGLCGNRTAVTDVTVAMYKKSDTTAPGALVQDLSNSKTQPWDFITFQVDGSKVAIVNYQAKDAVYHLSHAEVLALDPRKRKQTQPGVAVGRNTDYSLYAGDGFSITSVFDQPATAWCQHVYVPMLVIHKSSQDALDESIKPDYATFLQSEIVPKIRSICPSFPNSNEYFKQSIRLEFVPEGESRAMSSMGFAFGEDGALAWREGRQTERQIAVAAAKREEEGRLAAIAKRERERQAAAAQREREARRAASVGATTYEFIEVECSNTITGYMHTNTLVPYVKMSSRLSAEEIQSQIKANDDDVVDCLESLTTVLQVSNPYASGVKFDILDNAGKLVTQSEFSLTPGARTHPVDQPDSLTLFTGLWETSWFELEIRWDWGESEFKGVVTSVTPKGEELHFKVGDEVLSASIGNVVFEPDATIGVLATMTVIQGPDPVVLGGSLGIQLPPADFMVFWEGTGGNPDAHQLHFERVE